jgi:hypothetical protein
MNRTARPEIAIIGLNVGNGPFGELAVLFRRQLKSKGFSNGTTHLLLNVENIVHGAGLLLRPQVCVSRGIN